MGAARSGGVPSQTSASCDVEVALAAVNERAAELHEIHLVGH